MAVARVTVFNAHRLYQVNGAVVKKLTMKALGLIGKKDAAAELEIVFLDDRSIRALNKKYKRRDRPTDVLCFAIPRGASDGYAFLGEVFISLDTAFVNAAVFGTEFSDEITLYLVHALLHLFGYDDGTPVARARMSKKEGAILQWLRVNEDLSKVLTPR